MFNSDAVLEHSTTLAPTGIALSAKFLTTQVTDQITALGFVGIGVLVDSLRADRQPIFQSQAVTNLLGRQAQAQIQLHELPLRCIKLAGVATLCLSLSRFVLGQCSLVASGAGIAPELAADRRGAAAKFCANLRQMNTLASE
jgi:hypothetical protein